MSVSCHFLRFPKRTSRPTDTVSTAATEVLLFSRRRCYRGAGDGAVAECRLTGVAGRLVDAVEEGRESHPCTQDPMRVTSRFLIPRLRDRDSRRVCVMTRRG